MKPFTFQEFTEKIIENIKSYLPEEYADADIFTHKNPKPGNQLLTGISIVKSSTGIAPVLYLNELYEHYCSGDSFESILTTLSVQVQSKVPIPDVRSYLEWDAAKTLITSRFINIKNGQNDAYIADRPVNPLNGTNIGTIYDVDLKQATGQDVSVPITFALMEKWNVTISDLDRLARMNNPRLRPVTIKSMDQTIIDMGIGIDDEAAFPEVPELLYVVTNENLSFGAMAVTYDGVEKRLQQLLGDFYLLPSSVHEMLAVNRNMFSPSELSEMIQNINAGLVPAGEILDDIPYMLHNGQLIPANCDKQQDIPVIMPTIVLA